MGLYHDDVVISHSLSDPPGTLPAVIGWVVVLAVSAVLLRWQLGRWLVLDQETERYCGADEATEARWHGSYVAGFEVPDEV